MSDLLLNVVSGIARMLPEWLRKSMYKLGPITGSIRRGMNRMVPDGTTNVAVSSGEMQGIRMLLNLKTEKDIWLGTYESPVQKEIKKIVQPGMTAYDIGANIGFITLLLSKSVGKSGRVIAFEALPDNYRRLIANINLNHFATNIEIVPKAVVDFERDVEFMIGPSGGTGKVSGSKGRNNLEYGGVIQIPGISIDEYVYKYNNPVPDFIKIDIEGGEVMVIPGMKRVLELEKPLLMLELHGPDAAKVTLDELKAAGYHVLNLVSKDPVIEFQDDLDWKEYLLALP